MKNVMALFCLVLASSSVFAFDIQPIKQVATSAAFGVTKANWAYMGNRLDIQYIKATEKGRTVKVDLAIGSIDRPARLRNCITVKFDDNGYIKDMKQDIDSGSCE